MNIERQEIAIASRPRKKNLLRSSALRALWNRIGQRANYLNCFGCGNSLWWKEDISIAFRKPDQENSAWTNEVDISPDENQNFYEVPQQENTVIVYRHGVVFCRECFVNKSEQELIQIFEDVKSQWLINKTKPEDINRIKNYQLFLPLRTTKGTFKKEISEDLRVNSPYFVNIERPNKLLSFVLSLFVSRKF